MGEHLPADDKTITQSRSGITLRFDFRPDELLYHWRGTVDELRFATSYEHIWVRNPSYLTLDDVIFARRFFFAYIAFLATLISGILYFRVDPALGSGAILVCLVAFVLILKPHGISPVQATSQPQACELARVHPLRMQQSC